MFVCSEVKLFTEDGCPVPACNRGGICWLCGEKTICGDCTRNIQPNAVIEHIGISKMKDDDESNINSENDNNDWLKSYELWTCPGCLFDYPQSIHISDQLALYSEKRSSKYFPTKVTHELNVRGDCFLSHAEMFVLLYRFGGAINVVFNGHALIQFDRALSAILKVRLQTMTLPKLKRWITKQFVPLEIMLPPVVLESNPCDLGAVITTLARNLNKRFEKQMRIQTFGRELRAKRPDLPSVTEHIGITFQPDIQHKHLYPRDDRVLIKTCQIADVELDKIRTLLSQSRQLLRLYLQQCWKMAIMYNDLKMLFMVRDFRDYCKVEGVVTFMSWNQSIGQFVRYDLMDLSLVCLF